MIVEALIMGASLVGCAGCWATVQKHRISGEMQKHKLDHDLEVLRPQPEPKIELEPTSPSPVQQSLTALLERRQNLENHISELRKRVCDYSEARFAQYRADSLKALEDAREEQQELVLEQTGLLEMTQNMRVATDIVDELALTEPSECIDETDAEEVKRTEK